MNTAKQHTDALAVKNRRRRRRANEESETYWKTDEEVQIPSSMGDLLLPGNVNSPAATAAFSGLFQPARAASSSASTRNNLFFPSSSSALSCESVNRPIFDAAPNSKRQRLGVGVVGRECHDSSSLRKSIVSNNVVKPNYSEKCHKSSDNVTVPFHTKDCAYKNNTVCKVINKGSYKRHVQVEQKEERKNGTLTMFIKLGDSSLKLDNVCPDMTVLALKKTIHAEFLRREEEEERVNGGVAVSKEKKKTIVIPVERQRLIYRGRMLNKNREKLGRDLKMKMGSEEIGIYVHLVPLPEGKTASKRRPEENKSGSRSTPSTQSRQRLLNAIVNEPESGPISSRNIRHTSSRSSEPRRGRISSSVRQNSDLSPNDDDESRRNTNHLSLHTASENQHLTSQPPSALHMAPLEILTPSHSSLAASGMRLMSAPHSTTSTSSSTERATASQMRTVNSSSFPDFMHATNHFPDCGVASRMMRGLNPSTAMAERIVPSSFSNSLTDTQYNAASAMHSQSNMDSSLMENIRRAHLSSRSEVGGTGISGDAIFDRVSVPPRTASSNNALSNSMSSWDENVAQTRSLLDSLCTSLSIQVPRRRSSSNMRCPVGEYSRHSFSSFYDDDRQEAVVVSGTINNSHRDKHVETLSEMSRQLASIQDVLTPALLGMSDVLDPSQQQQQKRGEIDDSVQAQINNVATLLDRMSVASTKLAQVLRSTRQAVHSSRRHSLSDPDDVSNRRSSLVGSMSEIPLMGDVHSAPLSREQDNSIATRPEGSMDHLGSMSLMDVVMGGLSASNNGWNNSPSLPLRFSGGGGSEAEDSLSIFGDATSDALLSSGGGGTLTDTTRMTRGDMESLLSRGDYSRGNQIF
mmetsp:Transcript_37747/g.55616  ORF Transcript_37747/g.55616 Transcript_37747/m.55616 type:complete len:860 (-) Transcript_37747:178-2757(-)|eukprot:CAMPEP_0195523186 /NCGR_PEP_ID=MMETSP0794_2-20130614/22066_1 /TAXON_ID=515487 /ORGANISM="Stephanopyxis turris, Strain CCMP 815" /LENGTH=859 /DNA_ID=CAMNT_0040653107 /DNA_START=91 /DNA_END=2670 /DNA_ORIENTATION=+